MELVLASGNAHKAEEFQELLPTNIVSIKAASQKVEVVEDGQTYFENAFKKAKAYYDFNKVPVLSDDSGLNVNALPNELGIHSARFGGDDLTGEQRCDLLLEKMRDVELDARKAHFVCVLCLYLSPEEHYFFEGRMVGSIGYGKEGIDGFGYDPVFVPEKLPSGKSVATDHEWKQKNSHRSVAVSHLLKFLEGYKRA